MNEKMTTAELENVLRNTRPTAVSKVLSDHREELLSGDRPFSDYMRERIDAHGVSRQRIFVLAGISEGYGYKLLSGEKRTRRRDVILALCAAAGFDLSETQKALRLNAMPLLYARAARDAVLISAFSDERSGVDRVNALLEQNGFEPLQV